MVHVDSMHIPNDGQDRQHIPPNLSIFWATVRSAHISDQRLYEVGRSCSVDGGTIGDLRLERFKKYVEVKEVELWQVFQELDVDGSGRLGALKLSLALNNAGTKSHISQFIAILAASRRSDFEGFLFLPRRSSLADIYQLCNVRRRIAFGDGPATTPVEASRNEDKTLDLNAAVQRYLLQHQAQHGSEKNSAEEFSEDEENEPHTVLVQNSSLQFLLAGGFAGVVSRTCTAPFDRLKVFLITRLPHLGGCTVPAKPSLVNVAVFKNAVARIYAEGGVLAFWTGNGLSVAKVFPESAIKFFTYESAKRAFAKYWDDVDDPCEISGTSRFLSGGIGGISSQLSIYPVETLKTQMMTSMGHKRSIVAAIHHVWSLGGVRAYYRGLMIGLIGVFPYSAIDMSTFEALKLAYMKSTGKEQAGVLALLAFGSISGSIGAISVYPLNLVRTRLQASGSAGHPQRYSGVLDVAVKTWERDGWRGFYRGLFPTLAKVIPSVSITYTVYEYSKRRLGV